MRMEVLWFKHFLKCPNFNTTVKIFAHEFWATFKLQVAINVIIFPQEEEEKGGFKVLEEQITKNVSVVWNRAVLVWNSVPC